MSATPAQDLYEIRPLRALLNSIRACEGELTQPPPAGPLDKSHTSQGAIVDLYLLDGAA